MNATDDGDEPVGEFSELTMPREAQMDPLFDVQEAR